MADPIDYSDPCAVLPILREAYYKMLGGSRTERVRYRSGDNEREVVFGRADINALREEVRRLEIACQEKQTGRPARYGLRAGG
ncbi:hypothetical protein IMF23_04345 [Chelatococcus daeguensis]|uniref:hypothetical protein n=1 Tax=Chelatococcus daeguensis TaxID=444444 RepID=UPI0007AC169C|nr:hypothetical protein [Chelatococcus daeguensis]KZE34109.1 hypothetical protein AVW15_17495 [Chelatococcus daeguensis]MBM3082666.1 hypothetical protein [Chelatococcus daeguensis]